MAGPMEGIKVVELGFWVAGPAAGGILADWGADVVKVEPLDGDPFRGLAWFFSDSGDLNPPFELDNRSKRSIALEIRHPDGMAILLELIAGADVFITNLRPGAVDDARLDYESIRESNPRLIYASVTGYGLEGEDRDRPAFDVGAVWARSGVAHAITPPGAEYPMQRGGMGDHMTAMSAVGAISAALFHRERTGEGQEVRTSLLRLGAYMMGWDANLNLRCGIETVPMTRTTVPNPLITYYTAADGKSFWMLGLEGDRHWPQTVRALAKPEWEFDRRFDSIETRIVNATELTELIDGVIASKPIAEWTEIFDNHDVWWAPIQATHDLVNDPQLRANGGIVSVPTPDGSTAEMVASPVDFSGTPWEPRDIVPELGQHTELILMELGHDWDKIEALKTAGVIN